MNDLFIDLKAMIKETLGSRSEKLTEFKVAPRRKVLRTDRPKAGAALAAKRKAAAALQTQPDSKPAV